jgi:Spy/CpxP family protein refolding chaperone
MNTRGKTRLLLWLVVASAFVLGGVTGAALDGAYRLKAGGPPCREGRGGRGRERGGFEEMRRDLGLSDEQAAGVRAVLEQTREEYRALRAEARPRYEGIRQGARERIRALLTPEQRERFDRKAAERDARRRSGEERDER